MFSIDGSSISGCSRPIPKIASMTLSAIANSSSTVHGRWPAWTRSRDRATSTSVSRVRASSRRARGSATGASRSRMARASETSRRTSATRAWSTAAGAMEPRRALSRRQVGRRVVEPASSVGSSRRWRRRRGSRPGRRAPHGPLASRRPRRRCRQRSRREVGPGRPVPRRAAPAWDPSAVHLDWRRRGRRPHPRGGPGGAGPPARSPARPDLPATRRRLRAYSPRSNPRPGSAPSECTRALAGSNAMDPQQGDAHRLTDLRKAVGRLGIHHQQVQRHSGQRPVGGESMGGDDRSQGGPDQQDGQVAVGQPCGTQSRRDPPDRHPRERRHLRGADPRGARPRRPRQAEAQQHVPDRGHRAAPARSRRRAGVRRPRPGPPAHRLRGRSRGEGSRRWSGPLRAGRRRRCPRRSGRRRQRGRACPGATAGPRHRERHRRGGHAGRTLGAQQADRRHISSRSARRPGRHDRWRRPRPTSALPRRLSSRRRP